MGNVNSMYPCSAASRRILFLGLLFFLRLVYGFLSDTWRHPMVEAEGLKIFNIRCHLGFMIVSWKDFCSEVFVGYSIYFFEKRFRRFFECHLNDIKTFLDVPLPSINTPLYIQNYTYRNTLLYTQCPIWILHKFPESLLSSWFSRDDLISGSDKVHIFRRSVFALQSLQWRKDLSVIALVAGTIGSNFGWTTSSRNGNFWPWG